MNTQAGGSELQERLWAKARVVLPRGVSSGHRVGFQQVMVKAAGAYVWDANGGRYIDYLNAWGPIVLGHCNERVNDAVARAMRECDLTGVGPQLIEVEVAEKICEFMPSAQKVAFCTSGTDATLHAVHLARAATGRPLLMKFHGSYHGWHDSLAVGSPREDSTVTSELNTPNGAGLHSGAVQDVIVLEWNDLPAVELTFREFGSRLAAVFCEPYVHTYGCVSAQPGFLEALRSLCSKHGVLLVFDEIKTGFRAALGGYQSICGVVPDLTTFGKAVANGFSVSGVAGSDKIMAYLGAYSGERATIDGTYNASPYAMAAARATLDILANEDVIDHMYAMGERLREGLRQGIAAAGANACITGLGSEWAIYFRSEPPTRFREALDVDTSAYARYHAAMLQRGVLEPSFPTGDRRLSAAVSPDDIDYTIEAAFQSLKVAP